tara:strand:- start:36 stop:245 length:210 start_codon:yes stop_codon:yes gene_type:complete
METNGLSSTKYTLHTNDGRIVVALSDIIFHYGLGHGLYYDASGPEYFDYICMMNEAEKFMVRIADEVYE